MEPNEKYIYEVTSDSDKCSEENKMGDEEA